MGRENFSYNLIIRRGKIACAVLLVLTLLIPPSAFCSSPTPKRQLSEVAVAYRQILCLVPSDINSRLSLIHCLTADGNFKTALSEYDLIQESSCLEPLISSMLSALHLASTTPTQGTPDKLPSGYVIPGQLHFQLANQLLATGNDTKALFEYCLAALAPEPEPQAFREIGTLLAKSGDYLMGRNALTRYCKLSPFAFDFLTIANKIVRLNSHHGDEIAEELNKIEIAGTSSRFAD